MNTYSFVVYVISGAVASIIGSSKRFRSLLPLGLVLVALGFLDAYAENWRRLEGFHFLSTQMLLLALFLSAYALLSTKLILSNFEVPISRALLASASHVFFALLIALAYICFLVRSKENPPFAVLVFLSLICVLHVPMFAAFRARVITFESRRTTRPTFSRWSALLVIVIPFLGASVFQLAGNGDWRMLIPNGLICGSAWGLMVIAQSGERILAGNHSLSRT